MLTRETLSLSLFQINLSEFVLINLYINSNTRNGISISIKWFGQIKVNFVCNSPSRQWKKQTTVWKDFQKSLSNWFTIVWQIDEETRCGEIFCIRVSNPKYKINFIILKFQIQWRWTSCLLVGKWKSVRRKADFGQFKCISFGKGKKNV